MRTQIRTLTLAHMNFAAYLGGDMIIFLFIKVLRDDFYYWLPLRGFLGFIVAFLTRVTVKAIVDFAAVVREWARARCVYAANPQTSVTPMKLAASIGYVRANSSHPRTH